jgi:hypothetical protein
VLVRGEIKCLHCGHVSGIWVGANGTPLGAGGLQPGACDAGVDPAGNLRCGRCDGPVFLDDAGLVLSSYRLRRIRRLRDQIAALDAPQRLRPEAGRRRDRAA